MKKEEVKEKPQRNVRFKDEHDGESQEIDKIKDAPNDNNKTQSNFDLK